MARATWNETRSKSERASFDFYKIPLIIRAGKREIPLDGVLDTIQDQNQRTRSPEGTFPIYARFSCRRDDLGFLPTVQESLRIARADRPDEEQMYLVTSVDSTSDLFDIELQASTSNASPFR